MNRYAISWYNHATMTIKMDVVDAENEFEALKVAFNKLTRKSASSVGPATTISTIKALARAYDGAIEALEIYEPDFVSATQVIKRFLKGATNAIPTKEVPVLTH